MPPTSLFSQCIEASSFSVLATIILLSLFIWTRNSTRKEVLGKIRSGECDASAINGLTRKLQETRIAAENERLRHLVDEMKDTEKELAKVQKQFQSLDITLEHMKRDVHQYDVFMASQTLRLARRPRVRHG